MCLLNGEILDNNDDGLKPVAPLTTSNFLKEQLFGRKRLLRLVFCLRDLKYPRLADRINGYLVADAGAGGAYASFTEKYLHRMASELVAAIRARRKLRLGSIWDPTGQTAPYRAVFVWSNEDEDEDEEYSPPAFVFTSAWFHDPGSAAYDANNIDHHILLKVALEEPLVGNGPPRLRVRSWLLGMCFFDKCLHIKMAFP
ncbi:hypothetical protein DL765_009894 [Monosporascus sp. GIB2]|nr:hypothetical protein DL765_009894 [Monosporascus sp. GIB2]